MNSLIALVLKYSGFNKVWDFMDGKKTYAAAGLGILTSLAGLGADLAPILASHNTVALLSYAQALPSNPAWLSLLAALGALGIGHKIDKSVDVGIPLPNQPL